MKSERQLQIIETSMQLIADKGIQGFTIKNLAKEIGISEPAIYRHFSSKNAILISILNDFKSMGEMMTLIVSNDDTAIQKIEFMFSNMIDIFLEQPYIISVIFSEEIFKNDELLKNKIIEINNLHQSNVELIIAKGQMDKNVRADIDKSSLALIFMGSLRLLVKRWDLNSNSNNKFDLKVEGEKLLRNLKLIIGK